MERAASILLCLRYGIGDVVMETAVLTALRRARPRARLTVLGAPPAIQLLEGDPRIDEVVGIDRWGLTHRWDDGTPESRSAIGAWLEGRCFDLLLDVHHAATAVGHVVWDRGIRSLEADDAAEEEAVAAGAGGVAAIRTAVQRGWGLEVPADLAPEIRLHPSDEHFATTFLVEHAIAAAAPVGLSPVASLPMKRWPPDRLAAVADWVVEVAGRTPILFCGPQEDAGDGVSATMRHSDRLLRVGTLHLQRVAALLAQCGLVICNDTGLMHIAAAAGTPVVAIFGPTSPGIYLPPAPNAVGLVGPEVVCPHRNTASLHPPGCWSSERCLMAEMCCIRAVSLDAVLAAARAAIAGDAPARFHASTRA